MNKSFFVIGLALLACQVFLLANAQPGKESEIYRAVEDGIKREELADLLERQDRGSLEEILNSRDGDTPLRKAVETKQWDLVTLLLKYGSDPTLTTNVVGNLHSIIYTALQNDAPIDTLELMLASRDWGDINESLNNNRSALVLALQRKRWDVARLLLDFGEDPSRLVFTSLSESFDAPIEGEKAQLEAKMLLEHPQITPRREEEQDRAALRLRHASNTPFAHLYESLRQPAPLIKEPEPEGLFKSQTPSEKEVEELRALLHRIANPPSVRGKSATKTDPTSATHL